MRKPIQIGIIGDFNPQSRYHWATNASIRHAASALSREVEITWLPTPDLESAHEVADLEAFDGIWCSPGSPYESMQGALEAIRFARERGKPFVGT